MTYSSPRPGVCTFEVTRLIWWVDPETKSFLTPPMRREAVRQYQLEYGQKQRHVPSYLSPKVHVVRGPWPPTVHAPSLGIDRIILWLAENPGEEPAARPHAARSQRRCGQARALKS